MNERPSLTRLTKVELRKMVDTRSGFWLQLAVLGLTILSVVLTMVFGHESDNTFCHVLSDALAPAGVLLPMEWINSAQSLEPLTLEMLGGKAWGQVLVTLMLWMVLPLAVGLWRIAGRDLS